MVRCEMWCDVECCNFRHGVMWNVTEMQNVWCGMSWCGMLCPGMWNVLQCKMWKVIWCEMWCGIVMCEMWCGIVVMKNVAYAMRCAIVV